MNILLDCGTNFGQGLNKLNEKYNFLNNKDWKIHCFEPNPDIATQDIRNLSAENITFHRKAVWVREEELEFRQQNIGGSGSRLSNVEKIWNPNVLTKYTKVDAIDFSKFLLKFKQFNVVVKLDIEGAEYKVLRHIIDTGAIKVISELYCEWHERFFRKDRKETREMTNPLIDEMVNSNPKMKIYDWD